VTCSVPAFFQKCSAVHVHVGSTRVEYDGYMGTDVLASAPEHSQAITLTKLLRIDSDDILGKGVC
jgi:hypothetical protein